MYDRSIHKKRRIDRYWFGFEIKGACNVYNVHRLRKLNDIYLHVTSFITTMQVEERPFV